MESVSPPPSAAGCPQAPSPCPLGHQQTPPPRGRAWHKPRQPGWSGRSGASAGRLHGKAPHLSLMGCCACGLGSVHGASSADTGSAFLGGVGAQCRGLDRHSLARLRPPLLRWAAGGPGGAAQAVPFLLSYPPGAPPVPTPASAPRLCPTCSLETGVALTPPHPEPQPASCGLRGAARGLGHSTLVHAVTHSLANSHVSTA